MNYGSDLQLKSERSILEKLTSLGTQIYPACAAETEAAGIGVLIWSTNGPHTHACPLTSVASLWVAGRVEPQGSLVLHQYANARFGCPPDWRRVGNLSSLLEHTDHGTLTFRFIPRPYSRIR